MLLLALGCVYLLTSSLATRPGRGSGTRSRRGGPLDEELSPRVADVVVVPRQAELDAATELEAVPSPPPSPPPLLSRATKRWGQLLEEGLYHKSSGYFRVLPSRQQEDEWEFWQDRVLHEYPNGAWGGLGGWLGGCTVITRLTDPPSPPPKTGCRRGYGNNSSKKQCLPKLIIIGQFKAGTTALFDMLAQHPGILLPKRETWHKWHEACPLFKPTCVLKEVNGFSRIGVQQRFSEYALLSRYHVLPQQELDDERPVLEASPYYLAGMVDAMEDLTRFIRYIPDVKVIALVRNPVDRAFSEYLMFSEPPFRGNSTGCGHGPTAARFEDLAVEELGVASPALLEDQGLAHRCLVESSKWQHVPSIPGVPNGFKGRLLRWGEYHTYLSIWMRMLGPQQLVVVKNEDLDAHPERVLNELQAWAGLEVQPLKPLHTNLAGCRGSIARGAWDERKKRQAESGGCDGAGAWASQKNMDAGAAAGLRAHFKPHNRLLEELTGIDVSDWDDASSPLYLGEKGDADAAAWETRIAEAAAKGGRVTGAVAHPKGAADAQQQKPEWLESLVKNGGGAALPAEEPTPVRVAAGMQ